MVIFGVERHHHHRHRGCGAIHDLGTRAECGRHAAAYIQRDFDAFARRCDVLKCEFECAVQCVDDVNVGGPHQSAFVSTAFLICEHRDENAVWMDFGSSDVVDVGQAAEDVFGVMLGVAWWEDLGGGGDGGGGGGVCLFARRTLISYCSCFDDFDFVRAQFAKIAD